MCESKGNTALLPKLNYRWTKRKFPAKRTDEQVNKDFFNMILKKIENVENYMKFEDRDKTRRAIKVILRYYALLLERDSAICEYRESCQQRLHQLINSMELYATYSYSNKGYAICLQKIANTLIIMLHETGYEDISMVEVWMARGQI